MQKLPVFGKAHQASGAADFNWFVYGSSLDRESFAAWAREHGYRLPPFDGARPARLEGFRLAFDVASRFWGGAVADLLESPGEWVEGLAVPMPGVARGLVDHKEGAISGLFQPFPVVLRPGDGGPTFPALAYRASPSRRLPAEAPPAPEYLEILIRGARACGLSAPWVERLADLRRAAGAPGAAPD